MGFNNLTGFYQEKLGCLEVLGHRDIQTRFLLLPTLEQGRERLFYGVQLATSHRHYRQQLCRLQSFLFARVIQASTTVGSFMNRMQRTAAAATPETLGSLGPCGKHLTLNSTGAEELARRGRD